MEMMGGETRWDAFSRVKHSKQPPPTKNALPIACLWPVLPCSPRSNTVSTVNHHNVTDQLQEDVAIAIFDVTHQDLDSF